METPFGPSDDSQHPSKDMSVEPENSLNPLTNRNDSNIVTLEPFQKNSRRKKIRYRPNPTLIHFDSLFGLENWSRFLVLKTSQKISSTKLENILLSHCPTREMSFRLIKPNEWLVETTTKTQSEVFQSLNKIEGMEVSVIKHDKLNSIQGTVVLPTFEDEEELPPRHILLDSLKKRYSNVQDIELYEMPKKFHDKTLKIAKIKFEGQSLPQKIKIQGQNREVRPYIPKPLQCKSCSKFGHGENKCQATPVCAFCSSPNHPTKWNCGTPKCANCGLEHHSRAKECTFYMYNTELKLLVSRSGMSFREAKLELNARGFKDPTKNPIYKSRVRNIISQSIIEKYNDHITNVPSNAESNKITDFSPNKKYPVTTNNSYSILETVEVEVHQEDINENESDQLIKICDKEKSSTCNKRPFEKLSPIRNTNEDVKRSVKPKIQRNLEFKSKAKSQELLYNEGESVSASPVFKSKLKILKSPSNEIHIENCKCLECFQSEIDKFSDLPHKSICGCQKCFILDFKPIRPLTKEKLINFIRCFINNKCLDEEDQIELHRSGCMCKNHLIQYKKK